MQLNTEPDLLQNKIAIEVVSWRSQAQGAACKYDHVRTVNQVPAQQVIGGGTNSSIEAAKHNRVSGVGARMGVEIRYFADEALAGSPAPNEELQKHYARLWLPCSSFSFTNQR